VSGRERAVMSANDQEGDRVLGSLRRVNSCPGTPQLSERVSAADDLLLTVVGRLRQVAAAREYRVVDVSGESASGGYQPIRVPT
jgi:hypothetical protein